jgi:RHS repeat-associated protein
LVQQHDDFGRSRSWTYDQSGNVSQYRDFDGSEWQRDYGTWHLLLGLINPIGHELRYTYTPYGEIATFTDAGGAVSEYVYDLTDRLIEVWRCGVLKERYTRDAAGNLIAKHAGDGRELLRIEIGNGNLPARMVVSPDQSQAYRRDAQGRILEVEAVQSVLAFAYDKLGNRTEDRRNGLGVSHVFRSRRRPAETRLFDQFVIRYEAAGDTLILTDPMGQRHQLRFPGHGLVERHFANGTRETAQFDRLGRCLFKHIRHKGGETWSRRYDWSGEGELLSVKDSARGDRRYDYDAAHRLLRAYVRGEQATFTMDAADNLLAQPGLEATQFIEGNRLAAANGFPITYNDRNAFDRRGCPSGETRYIYDGREALVRVEQPNGVFEAAYDGIGRRTRTVWSGQVTEFYWNTDQLIAEKRSDGTLRIYIYPDPLALTPMLFVEYDGFDALPESGRRYVVLSDQIGTPLLVEDDDGRIVWRAEIAPFGTAALWPKNTITLNLRFPGHYFDVETGLHYNRFRYYDPQLGRYIQSDPWGIAGTYNLYAYPANPLLDVDIRGLGEENDKNCKQAGEDADADEKAALKRQKGDIAAGEDLGLIDKPDMAPNFDTWRKKGGTILLSEDGSITYTRADGVSVTYRNGYPDFSPHEAARVEITQSTDRSADFRAANEQINYPGNKPPPGYTWHHNENGTTMQLVPSDIHDDFTHSGGVSNVRAQNASAQ